MKEKEINRKSKLNLDFSIVEKAREAASVIALDTQKFIDQHTTTTIERTVCRLFGIDGVDKFDVPLPNILVDNLVVSLSGPNPHHPPTRQDAALERTPTF